MLRTLTTALIALAPLTGWAQALSLEEAVASELRTPANVERDPFRNPIETLKYYDVKPHHHVVEIWPGRGWYSEILAPYLKDQGQYYAAHFPATSSVNFYRNMRLKFDEKIKQTPALFDKTIVTDFAPPDEVDIAPEGTIDRVLTFRNVHNWMKSDSDQAAFNAFFKALKPGGILGVVEHRAKPKTDKDTTVKSGYVTEEYVKTIATNAGFLWVSASDINANQKDTTDHPKGVWTLPPTLRLGDEKRDYYTDIGESDRMTLRFLKPN